jgi:aspartate aminotransferase
MSGSAPRPTISRRPPTAESSHPAHIVAAASKATEAGHTKYDDNAGLLELRQQLCRKLKTHNKIDGSPDEIIITHGAMGALYSAFAGLVEPGDEVLLPDPSWPNFLMMATLRSAITQTYRIASENGFLPIWPSLKRWSRRTPSCC